jgi:hypothetical protein
VSEKKESGAQVQYDLQAKWYVNGFPKAGTHLALALISPMAKKMPSTAFRDRPWASRWQDTFKHTERHWPALAWHVSELLPGYWFKAHSGWSHDLEALLWCLGVCHIFVYRDPRDVAVSLLYHILSDDEVLMHSGRAQFRALGDKDDVLRGIITGIDGYPGVMERWKAYAPWLDSEWTFKLRYEEAVADLSGTADAIIRYALDRIGGIFELHFEQPDTAEAVALMVAAAQDTGASLSFRAGRTGDWRSEFNAGHAELFKETDRDGWLVRLGYEESPDW